MNRIPSQNESSGSEQRLSLAGSLLVATPSVVEPMFARSVCIVVEHTQERSIGIFLNKPLEIDTKPLWDQLLQGSATPEAVGHVNFGGPQDGPVLAIHDDESLAEGGNNQGVYLSAQAETLKKLAMSMPNHCRLFVGHASWGHGQLEQQIIDGLWHVLPALPDLVFLDEPSMWGKGIRFVGDAAIREITGLSNLPVHPQLN